VASIGKIAGGLICGAALSQFPEYSQQYVQRMGGALDELSTVVLDFDISAKASGYSREEALGVMTGTEFLDARQSDMKRAFKRFDTLSEDYSRLQYANAFSRLAYVARMRDSEVLNGTTKDFKPGVPLTFDGAGFVGLGFLFGFGLIGAIQLWWRRRKKKQVEV
jgi:hypothetical protein